jgi:hypothetical protein
MSKFRKKPVVIEAVQFVAEGNSMELGELLSACVHDFNGDHLLIHTLEGVMRADLNDWIIRGVKGELYPIKNEIFRETYEAVYAA